MGLEYYYAKFFKKILVGRSVKNSDIDKTAKINAGSNILDCKIGRYTNIGYYNELINTEVGSFCAFSDYVYIGLPQHPVDWVSMSPVFENNRHSGPNKKFAQLELPPRSVTIIGNDVWIGHNVSIMAGVKVGDGAVIGAGAVVTKDIEPYAIVAGVPASTIRYRFDADTIKALSDSRWWDFDEDRLKEVAQYMNDPKEFLKRL